MRMILNPALALTALWFGLFPTTVTAQTFAPSVGGGGFDIPMPGDLPGGALDGLQNDWSFPDPGNDIPLDIPPLLNKDALDYLLGEDGTLKKGVPDIPFDTGNSFSDILDGFDTGALDRVVEGYAKNGLSISITHLENQRRLYQRFMAPEFAPAPYLPAVRIDGINPACICGGDPTSPVPVPTVVTTGGKGTAIDCSMIKKAQGLCEQSTRASGGLLWAPEPNRGAQPYVTNWSIRNSPDSFATTVALAGENNVTFCSGVLIGPRHILSAAHCFCDGTSPRYAFFGDKAWADLSGKPDGLRAQLWLSGEVHEFDPGFCKAYRAWDANPDDAVPFPKGDLAILPLLREVDPALSIAVLPTEPLWSDQPIDRASVAGFGVAEGDNSTGRKHHARVNVLPDSCAGADYTCHGGSEFVAVAPDLEGNADSCFADSGGPLFIQSGAIPYLAGIVSRGTSNNDANRCGKGGIYVDLRNQHVRDWIIDTTTPAN